MEAQSDITSTYRIQFSTNLTFRDADRLINYLKELGVSHLYASPIMEAVPGSTHGYDVTDFARIREELGGETEFKRLNSNLRKNGIGWVQDFVPNHMAMDTRNPYLRDILRNGKDSRFADLFDIYWKHPAFENGKVCLPILDKPYYQELEAGSFSFEVEDEISLRYNDIRIPLSPASYKKLIGKGLSADITGIFPRQQNDALNNVNITSPRIDDKILQQISEKLRESNEDRKLVDDVISMQNYSLRPWNSTDFEINYRRFFAVDGLICLREEDGKVFRQVHEKLINLVKSGEIDGIRIDHVDGLYDPEKYLKELRDAVGNAYIMVEKILERNEFLDPQWPVQGTTGYDFLGKITSLMCSAANIGHLKAIYEGFTGNQQEKEEMVYSMKLDAMDTLFPAVLDILADVFWVEMKKKPFGRDLTFHGVREVLREILAHAPIYRTYLSGSYPSEKYLVVINSILQKSKSSRQDLSAYFDSVSLFLNQYIENPGAARAIQILQQYMPAIYAKPIEDGLFYNYNRLISLNDVGMNPLNQPVSLEEFHSFIIKRHEIFPLSINVLSTHDTKISEDIRARISVLSEIPVEWEKTIGKWNKINSRFSSEVDGKPCPSRNEEYYIYQLLLGSHPFSEPEPDNYRERLIGHLIKSIREAGVNTNWDAPALEYEKRFTDFVNSLTDRSINNEFVDDFWKIYPLISYHGFLNSISQKIVQMTAPGVPDTYQGTETWNFNLVDPDNRRKVDFDRISELHRQVMDEFNRDHGAASAYLQQYSDGRIKILITSVLLNLRQRFPDLFLDGTYAPIYADGPQMGNMVAFCRTAGAKGLIVIVPRLTLSLGRMKLPAGNEIWGNNTITIPDGIDGDFEDVFSGRIHSFSPGKRFEVGDLMHNLPFLVAISR